MRTSEVYFDVISLSFSNKKINAQQEENKSK